MINGNKTIHMIQDPPPECFKDGGAWIVSPPDGFKPLDFDLRKAAKYVEDHGLKRVTPEIKKMFKK